MKYFIAKKKFDNFLWKKVNVFLYPEGFFLTSKNGTAHPALCNGGVSRRQNKKTLHDIGFLLLNINYDF